MPAWKIAAVQMDCRLADRPHNLAAIRERLAACAGAGAKLVVFPECVLGGYSFKSKADAWPHAESIPGPSVEAIGEDCKRLGVSAIVGMLEQADDGRLFNAAALILPDGRIHSYRKVHLPCLGVDRFATPGDRPFAVHDLGGLRVGMHICYDCSFPESARALALQGADLIVLPTNWPEGARRVARYLPAARALENAVYFLAANRVGEEAGFRFIGQSRIHDVNGDLLAVCDHDREEAIYADIDPARARAKRTVFIPGEYEVDRVGDRRPEMYAELSSPKG